MDAQSFFYRGGTEYRSQRVSHEDRVLSVTAGNHSTKEPKGQKETSSSSNMGLVGGSPSC